MCILCVHYSHVYSIRAFLDVAVGVSVGVTVGVKVGSVYGCKYEVYA